MTKILTRQQFCAEFKVSESTARRMEHDGMPVMRNGAGGHPRYDFDKCKAWLEGRNCQSGSTKTAEGMSASWSRAGAFTESFRKAQLRVMPS